MWLSQIQKSFLSQSNNFLVPLRSYSSKSAQFFPSIPSGYKIKRFYKKVDIVEHPKSEGEQKLKSKDEVTFKNLSLSDQYWAVTLDGKPVKTLYKDELLIPTKALAVGLAEEWESQKEHINLKSLHLHNFLGRCVRVSHDHEIKDHIKEELFSILENDQICFREEDNQENEYKSGLSKAQKSHTQKIFEILESNFGITLKIFHNIQMEPQDKSISKLRPLLDELDPFVLQSLYSVAQSAKSTAIALSLILRNDLEIQEAVNIARVDENYQTSIYGKVEGAHDFDEAHTLTTFATAKSLVNLCQLREF